MTRREEPQRGSVASGILSTVERGTETRALEVFIGNWINEGRLMVDGTDSGRIVTSDVYEWAQGGFFVVHRAYGRLAGADVGGVEIMGWDTAEQSYRSWFFDSQGNAAANQLLHPEPDVWRWQGIATRSTSTFSEEGKIQTTLHERLEGGAWITSMEVVLTRVD
jgi:Protein of unknown function (DUF1579)